MASAPLTFPSAHKSNPAWEIAHLFPDQGHLSEGDYLSLTENTQRLAEFNDGRIEVLPMPTIEHQRIILFLVNLLGAFVNPRNLGEALMSPLRVRIGERQYREPDVVFLSQAKSSAQGDRYWEGADLVMEVVSEDDPNRDLVDKRRDYAACGILEYWIVDPRDRTITVLRLESGEYVSHSQAKGTGAVRSALLDGFTADAAAVFAAGKRV